MWGFGGRFYWGRRKTSVVAVDVDVDDDDSKMEGIVVIFAWMSSHERHLKNYVDLYSDIGWNSLVCHSQFLNMFFPDKATTIAADVLSELVKELKVRPRPVVFVSFSGGPKACMYKVLQIIEGTCDAQINMDECRLVKDCLTGFIYDSSPVDFTSDIGTRFVLHPSVLKMSQPPRIASWVANRIASSLDSIFMSRFERHRAEYWQTLYSSVSLKAPYLILCSENDDLAPYQTISNFVQRLNELGADVKLVKCEGSPHVAHYRHYPVDYKAAVIELLGKAAVVYSQRIQQLEGEGMDLKGTHDTMSEPFRNLRKAAASSSISFRGTALEPSGDHLFMPSSIEYYEGRDVGSVQNEHKDGLIRMPNPPKINLQGVLGQILFDVCIPKDVEEWDLRPSSSLNGSTYRRHAPFNPMKCIRRSRL